jgi:GR25 family glycosyltransferase involved in LPS biosynthesis
VLSNATFEVFHTDAGNEVRNRSYEGILKTMSFLPRLGSPTMYLNTAEKAENFINEYPEFKVNTVHDYAQPGETFPPSAGVVGVWASNWMAYKAFLETDKDVLFIFEDDIVLSKNFETITNFYMQELLPTWDFFSLFVPDDSLFAYKPEEHDIYEEHVCKSYQQWSCAAYAVSRRGAEKALKDIATRGITAPVDWYVFNFRMKAEQDQMRFATYTLKPEVYQPVKFLLEAAAHSQIHRGSTELLHTA